MMNLQQLATLVDGELVGNSCSFNAISTDTRQIKPGDLFVALQGDHYDANNFASNAADKGAVAALLSADVALNIPYIKVTDTLQALSILATEKRDALAIPLVAITGSNGKTTVKEMLASILAQSSNVLATSGNLNNHIGVPLTLLRLTPKHDVAVVEMGASKQGDIAHLCRIAKPTIAVLNNIAPAHLEGFGDLDGVAKAKAEIISGLSAEGTAVLNKSEPWFDQWVGLLAGRKQLSFGVSNDADVWANPELITTGLHKAAFKTCFVLNYQQQSIDIQLNLIGRHNVMNALAASAAAIALGCSLTQIQHGLANLQDVNGRLQVLPGLSGSLVVNDCYNANPSSFEAAMDCLNEIDQPLWVVLGDFAELGPASEAIHQRIGQQLAASNAQRFFAVGEKMQGAINAFNKHVSTSTRPAKHFLNKQKMTEVLQQELEPGVLVLVKGSRSQGLESIVNKIISKGKNVCC